MIALLLLLLSFPALADDITCTQVPYPMPSATFAKCQFADTEAFNPPDFSGNYPIGFLSATAAGTHPLVMHWDGYGSQANCPNWDKAKADKVVVKNCADYWANVRVNNMQVWGYGGPYLDDAPTQRSIAAVRYAQQTYPVDVGAGIMFQGSSYGAASSVHQALMWDLVDPLVHSQITKVNASQAPTSFFDPGGNWWRVPNIRPAWANFDVDLLDPVKQAHKLKYIYLAYQASPRDPFGFQTDYFNRLCDTHRISCYAVWHDCGHALPSPECSAPLPWNNMFAAPNQDVRLDDSFIVAFTEATSNRWGPNGGYNLGLSWDSRTFNSTEYAAQVSIRYKRLTNIAPIEDQPIESQVKVTLRMRDSSLLNLTYGDIIEWNYAGQTATTVVFFDNEVTIPLVMQSSESYLPLTVTKTGRVPGC